MYCFGYHSLTSFFNKNPDYQSVFTEISLKYPGAFHFKKNISEVDMMNGEKKVFVVALNNCGAFAGFGTICAV